MTQPRHETDPDHPDIRAFILGPFETNCYVLARGAACWVIDLGFEPDELLDHLDGSGLTPQKLILTHAHVDHIAGVAQFRRRYPDAPILIHSAEARWLGDPDLNLSALMGMPVTAPGPDDVLEEGQVLNLAGSRWTVHHTPGHSPGGITLHNPELAAAFVGDTLFYGSIGRHDFPGSSFDVLAASIRDKLYTLPDATRVLPGHMIETTIGREKRSNPFVRG